MLMVKENLKAPPLYMPARKCSNEPDWLITRVCKHLPSSGVMVRVKLRRSEGSEKCVFIVAGRSSSVRSVLKQ